MMTLMASDTPITLADRCDRCGAAAKARATFLNGELLFCGHHLRESIPMLKEKAVTMYDPEGLVYDA
jgi:hypothetical protein